MNETEVLNEFFIWEENNLTEPKMKSVNSGVNEHKNTTNETKTDLTPNDWKDITDLKLRNIMRQRAWRKSNRDKIKKYNDTSKNKRKAYYEDKKEEILSKRKDYYESNKDKFKEQNKSYYEDNKEEIKNQVKSYRESNPDKIKERKKNYYNKNKVKVIKKSKDYYSINKEKKKEYDKIYNKVNKKKRNKYKKFRRENDIQYKLTTSLRSRLNNALKRNQKSGSAVKDLGCTIEEFKVYLESKFQLGMNWDNWSFDGWHIDHIKPLASFDLTDRKQLLDACHYTNLQPLWAKDNLAKSDKIV